MKKQDIVNRMKSTLTSLDKAQQEQYKRWDDIIAQIRATYSYPGFEGILKQMVTEAEGHRDDALADVERKKKAIHDEMNAVKEGSSNGVRWLVEQLGRGLPPHPNVHIYASKCTQHPSWKTAYISGNVPTEIMAYFLMEHGVIWSPLTQPFAVPHDIFAGPFMSQLNMVCFHAPTEKVSEMVEWFDEIRERSREGFRGRTDVVWLDNEQPS